jgi:hypothetical protein
MIARRRPPRITCQIRDQTMVVEEGVRDGRELELGVIAGPVILLGGEEAWAWVAGEGEGRDHRCRNLKGAAPRRGKRPSSLALRARTINVRFAKATVPDGSAWELKLSCELLCVRTKFPVMTLVCLWCARNGLNGRHPRRFQVSLDLTLELLAVHPITAHLQELPPDYPANCCISFQKPASKHCTSCYLSSCD